MPSLVRRRRSSGRSRTGTAPESPLSLRMYRSTAKPRRRSNRLVVAMSHEAKPVLGRLEYGTHYACVWELRESSYYVRQAGTCVAQLNSWLSARDVEQVCFFGLSKGGFGSLLWGSLLARARPDLSVSSMAFSPQVQIWPVNKNIVFPSYLQMVDTANTRQNDRHLRAGLAAYGTLPDASGLANYYARIIYPGKRVRDVREANKIKWSNADKETLDLSIHNTLIPHIVDTADEQAVSQAVARLLGMGSRDADVRSSTGTGRLAEMVAEYQALPPQPPLPQLLRDVMDTNLARRSSVAAAT